METTAVLFDDQAFDVAAVAVPVSCAWAFTHMVLFPEIVGKGFVLTVID